MCAHALRTRERFCQRTQFVGGEERERERERETRGHSSKEGSHAPGAPNGESIYGSHTRRHAGTLACGFLLCFRRVIKLHIWFIANVHKIINTKKGNELDHVAHSVMCTVRTAVTSCPSRLPVKKGQSAPPVPKMYLTHHREVHMQQKKTIVALFLCLLIRH